jgi:hypothetical protein
MNLLFYLEFSNETHIFLKKSNTIEEIMEKPFEKKNGIFQQINTYTIIWN